MPKRKLLLADDSMTIQKVVNLTFADEGIEVITAADGVSAMEKFVETAPDLVLADVNVPGLNGYQICAEIKQSEPTKNIPVILLVGSFEPFDQDEARRVGADDYMTKPFQSIRQLINKVSDLLNSNKNGEAAPDGVKGEVLTNTETINERSEEVFDSSGTTEDGMVQTDQIGSLPVDDAHKFEANFVSEPSEEIFEQNKTDAHASFSDAENYEPSETFEIETQALTAEDYGESITAETKEPAASEQSFESFDANYLPESNLAAQPKTSSSLKLDQTNLLEIPPMEISLSAANFPPELIEAIADKVIEKLSDQAVRETAREVVPQMAEMIIRQMTQEKLNH